MLGAIPRGAALAIGRFVAWTTFHLSKKLRTIAEHNLKLALPELGPDDREQIVRGVFANLGRLLAEFCQLPTLTKENVSQRVIYDGYENFSTALQRGAGVLFLTAHYGAWELCPYAHALYGHPLKFLVRPIDNPLVDELVNRYRMGSGNQVIEKKNSLKEILVTLKRGAAVGILIDQNTFREAGVFAPFFNIPGLHHHQSGDYRLADRSRHCSGCIDLGRTPQKTPAAIRTARDTGADRQQTRGHSGQHNSVQSGAGRAGAQTSGPVAMGSPPLENATGR